MSDGMFKDVFSVGWSFRELTLSQTNLMLTMIQLVAPDKGISSVPFWTTAVWYVIPSIADSSGSTRTLADIHTLSISEEKLELYSHCHVKNAGTM